MPRLRWHGQARNWQAQKREATITQLNNMSTMATAPQLARVPDLYAAYWRAFDAYVDRVGDDWMKERRRDSYWTSFQLHRPGVHIACVILTPPRRPERAIRVELSLIKKVVGANADWLFDLLKNWRAGLEATVGADLEFESHTPNQYQVAKTFLDCDPWSQQDWPRQQALLVEWLRRFNDAFGARGNL